MNHAKPLDKSLALILWNFLKKADRDRRTVRYIHDWFSIRANPMKNPYLKHMGSPLVWKQVNLIPGIMYKIRTELPTGWERISIKCISARSMNIPDGSVTSVSMYFVGHVCSAITVKCTLIRKEDNS